MKDKKEGVGFSLLGVKTEEFATFEENFTSKKKIELKTGVEFKIQEKNKQIGVYVAFGFNQGKQTFLKIKISCHYGISPETWADFISEDEKMIAFPLNFMRHLTVLAIGTARGVLHCKTEGSQFNKYVLPTINVNELLAEDISFDLN